MQRSRFSATSVGVLLRPTTRGSVEGQDGLTGFSEEFSHAGGAQPRNPDLRRNLYAALIA